MKAKDRVSTAVPYNGAIQHGVVISVAGGKVSVLLDDGVSRVSGPARLFVISDKPLPVALRNRFVKDDRVESVSPHKGEVLCGIVMSVSGVMVKVLLDDGERVFRAPASRFTLSAKAVPAKLTNPFRVKDRVEWDAEGAVRFGTVTGVFGIKVKVTEDGGENLISGMASVFRLSTTPLVLDETKTPMDAYEVRGYRVVAGHDDSTPFVASIFRDGKKILSASDDGWGGGSCYHGEPADEQKFYEDAQKWAAINGRKAPTGGSADLWVEWVVSRKPFGVMARDYLDFGKLFQQEAP